VSFEAIGIGDLHLTDTAGKGGLAAYIKNHDEVVMQLVTQCLQFAKKRGIKNVFLYGDLCEGTRMSYQGQLALIGLFNTNPNFVFHIILGNHDKIAELSSMGHSLQIIQAMNLFNVKIYEEDTVVTFGDAKVNFMPWPSTAFKKRSDLLNVAHVDVQGAKSDSGRLFDSDKLSDTKALSVIGHIHTMQKIRNTYYSGTLYQTNFGESQEKFFHHLVFDGSWEIFNIPVKPIYTLHSVEVSSKKDLKSLPASPTDLIKLILLDGCEITAADYGQLNVVKVRSVKGEKDLALARIEDLTSGSEIEISSKEFFVEWLRNQNVDRELKKQAVRLRKQLLENS
jgi:hypothetical protein